MAVFDFFSTRFSLVFGFYVSGSSRVVCEVLAGGVIRDVEKVTLRLSGKNETIFCAESPMKSGVWRGGQDLLQTLADASETNSETK